MRSALAVLGIAYPLVSHLAIETQSATTTGVALLLLALIVSVALLPRLVRGGKWAWAAIVPCAALLVMLYRGDAMVLLLYLPPVVINLGLAWLFGHTLVGRRTPLIAQLVRLLHAPGAVLDAGVVPYARRLTFAWAALFVALAITNAALALFATPDGVLLLAGVGTPLPVPREWWSVFANFANYAIVVAFFVAEYLYRQQRFPDQPYAGFVDFCRRAAAAGPVLLAHGPDARRNPPGSP